MFDAARSAGACTAIMTVSETPFDATADLKIEAPVERMLPAIAQRVASPLSPG